MPGEPVSLTPIESDLLRLFAANEGKLLTHPAILREVWGPAYGEESNYLHVYVSHLRRKIEPDPARPRYLLTEPGVGYRLAGPARREEARAPRRPQRARPPPPAAPDAGTAPA